MGKLPWLMASEVETFLGQTEFWWNKDNERIPLSNIDKSYAQNIMRFLEHKAEELWDLADQYRAWVSAGMDEGPVEGMPRGYVDVEWMRRTKLYRALSERTYDEVNSGCRHGWTGLDFCPECSDEVLGDIEERGHQFGHGHNG